MALFDSGASRSLMSVELFHKLRATSEAAEALTKLGEVGITLVDINNQPLQTLGIVKVPFRFNNDLL